MLWLLRDHALGYMGKHPARQVDLRAAQATAALEAGGANCDIRGNRRQEALMSSFEDRENAFENKFAHDAEMQFKAEARRNKLLGLWAAGLMGKDDAAAEDYAKEVIRADFEEAGDEDVYRKLAGDLGDNADEATIRAKMTELMVQAKAQLMDEA
jgi:hypothetical protein